MGTIGLVADIGRQSVRFALTEGGGAPRDIRKFLTTEHQTFTSALLDYLNDLGMADERLPSVLAVAGAARGDLINLTGSRWYISLSGVEAVLRAPPRALNECAANALALSTLPPQAFEGLGGPAARAPVPGGSYVVIGAGTGLGVAALVSHGARLVPVQSEAGHMALAASTPDEVRFVEHLKGRGLTPSAETLLSASGLVAAYAALSDGRSMASSEEVVRAIGHDRAAAAAVQLFIDYLGALAGDLVLAFGAWDGVFLTGGIARGLKHKLSDPRFRARMEAKDAFRRQLSQVPVAVVNRNDLELVGAAVALESPA